MWTDPSQEPADARVNPARTGESDEPVSCSEETPVPRERRKIQVGSRTAGTRSGRPPRAATEGGQAGARTQETSGTGATGDKPADQASSRGPGEADGGAIPEQPESRVPRPSRHDRLTPEMERELEMALGGASMEELLGAAPAVGAESEALEVDSRHPATVVKIHGDNVFCSLGGRNDAVASLRQFDEPPAIGTQIEVIIRSYHAEDGLYEVSVPGASVEVHDWSDLVEGAVVEARITGSNVGGLECLVNQIRGFIPASQVGMHRVDNFAEYYDQKLPCVVTEANERRRNLVLSHRAVLEREKQAERERLMEELEVGQIREGHVRSLRPFGAFIDLGGLDGLVHISQLSWERVGHPSEILQEGQKVRVKVEKIDPQTGKIGLSYRDLLDHPWDRVDEQFAVESTVKGTVTRIAKFGAFVKIAPGIEGLVHISELAHHRVVQVSSVVEEGQEIDVKVLSIDRENQRISLSLKAAHPLAESPEAEVGEEPAEEPRPDPLVKPRQEPLRGGREGSSGGERFGLHW